MFGAFLSHLFLVAGQIINDGCEGKTFLESAQSQWEFRPLEVTIFILATQLLLHKFDSGR
jgi:hypothetical protein